MSLDSILDELYWTPEKIKELDERLQVNKVTTWEENKKHSTNKDGTQRSN